MLREIFKTRQASNTENRRWFSDADMDLYVWQDQQANITRFQLCYSKGKDEHAFAWNLPDRCNHHRIDDGEGKDFRHKGSPILVPDGDFDSQRLARQFVSKSRELDSGLVRFVREKLNLWRSANEDKR